MKYILEIAANNISSAIAAYKGGADRIELCDNLSEGGTTPSYATIQYCVAHIPIPCFPIIRPRGGDFLYSEIEFQLMKKDIEMCKKLGCEGVVLGVLDEYGNVDMLRCQKLMQIAYPMSVTFHRAFDRTKDAFQSLEDIIALGCERILTSGQKTAAWEGKDLIQALIQKANHRIIIMPGAGVNETNLPKLIETLSTYEFHGSMKGEGQSRMHYQNPDLGADSFIETDVEKVKKMKGIMPNLS